MPSSVRLSFAALVATIVVKFLAGTAVPLMFTELVWNVMSDVYAVRMGTSTMNGSEGGT